MAVVAQKTPCLILDEPTNHLDITYQLELLDIVKSLNTEEVLTTQMIREVYHVESQIVYDADGHMHILYLQNGHSHT